MTFDTQKHEEDYQRRNPIAPGDEWICMFGGRQWPEAVQALKDVFNKHGRGEIVTRCGHGVVVRDVDWAVVNTLREMTAARDMTGKGKLLVSIGPNRTVRPC